MRGGGGEIREDGGRFGEEGESEFRNDLQGEDASVEREGDGDYRVDGGEEADVNVKPEGDGMDNVNVRTADGRDFDANVAGPDGYRAGYVWRDGNYVAVDCEPWVPYAATVGAWAGWNIITQPEYTQYPVYATYPIETAVQVALQTLGLYTGQIDGSLASCGEAITQYQEENNLPVTGTITPELLNALGIQASEP